MSSGIVQPDSIRKVYDITTVYFSYSSGLRYHYNIKRKFSFKGDGYPRRNNQLRKDRIKLIYNNEQTQVGFKPAPLVAFEFTKKHSVTLHKHGRSLHKLIKIIEFN